MGFPDFLGFSLFGSVGLDLGHFSSLACLPLAAVHLGPGRGFPSRCNGVTRVPLRQRSRPWRCPWVSPTQPGCSRRVSGMLRDTLGASPGRAPTPPSQRRIPPGPLPEEENHNWSSGAGRAPRQRGRQPSSLLAGPCRRLAAAPGDLRATPVPPRCHRLPTELPPRSSDPQNSALLFKLCGFCSGMTRPSRCVCVCAELLRSLQLLPRGLTNPQNIYFGGSCPVFWEEEGFKSRFLAGFGWV